MLTTSQGLILSTQRHKESTAIIRAMTEAHGRVTLMAYGIYSRSAKQAKQGLLQPLTMLEMVYDHRADRDIHRLEEFRVSAPLKTLTIDPIKSSLALFQAEVLIRVLREEEADSELFHYVRQGILELDAAQSGLADLPLHWVVGLSVRLGWLPDSGEGVERELIVSGYPPDSARAPLFDALLAGSDLPAMSGRTRRALLDALLAYLRLHAPFGPIRSLDVLGAVLS